MVLTSFAELEGRSLDELLPDFESSSLTSWKTAIYNGVKCKRNALKAKSFLIEMESGLRK